MIDISNQEIEVNCPHCQRSISVTLKQVADEILVKCVCGQSIQLEDSKGTNRKAIRDINQSFKSLETAFKNFGK